MIIIFKPLSSAVRDPVQFDLNDASPRLTVGRKPDNDFVIPLPNVSSYHAVVELDGESPMVEDLNSTNGVFKNGQRLDERTAFENGDRLSFGSVDFLVEIEGASKKAESGPGNGTLMVDSREFLDDIREEAPAGGSGQMPSPGAGTMLFGMKDVLMAPRLVLLDDKLNPVSEHNVDRVEVNIGREADNDVQIDHDSISRLHAKIIKKSDKSYQLQDNQSTNGTFVDDRRVTRHMLRHGDVVQFGDVKAVFLAPGKLFSFEDLKEGKKPASGGMDRKKLLIGAAGVLVVLLIILMLLPTGGGGGPSGSGTRLTSDEVMKEVNFALDNGDWDRVVQLVDNFQLKGADEQLKKAKSEIENRKVFQAVNQKIEAADFQGARDAMSGIGSGSVYRARADQALKDGIESYIEKQNQTIEEKQESSDYKEALDIAAALKDKFPDREDVSTTYDSVKSAYDRVSRQQQQRAAYASKLRRTRQAADRKIAEAESQYLKGELVEALASITEASNVYIEKGITVPVRIKRLKDSMNELRQNYQDGKKLILQGKLEQAAPKLDRVFDISDKYLFGKSGAIERECTGLLVDYYMEKANQLYKQQNYAAAYGFLNRILDAKPDMREAQVMRREIEGKGQELYNKGYIEQTQYQNCKQAVFYFKQVVQMVPKDNPLYKKALKRIADCED